ncbi:hypothetical protein ACPXCE_03755 [Streptomyces sp. DT24]|uniref:hypothetical protein n=1 Tax=Streptomyces sp. DT24 TaxID=3416520 RepID=UPI003CEFEA2D
MRRPSLPLAVAAGLLVLTGCATVVTGTASGATPPASATGAGPSSTAPGHEDDPVKAARATHDRLFPDVAAHCAGAAPRPTDERTPTRRADPVDPAASRYAENHMYRQKRPLDTEQRCRGQAHADRIAKVLKKPGAPGTRTEQGLRTALAELGYPEDAIRIQEQGSGQRSGPAFSLFIPGTGPCVTGRTGPPPDIETHGPYLEGGCVEPRGGH